MSTVINGRSPVQWPGLDGAPTARFSLAIVGDVRVELRTELPDRSFTELTEDHLGYAPVRPMVAGTAINLARHAVGYFRTVTVIGRIGDDAFTPVIRQCLRELGVTDRLSAEPGTPNGFSVMLRDRPAPDRHGVRLLVAGDGAPSGRMSAADLHRSAAAVERADVLFVDGYALLSAVSRDGLRAAMRIARAAGTLVAFDLVPHDIAVRLPRQDVLPVLAGADVILTEAQTVAGLLGRPAPAGSAGARDLLPELDRALEGALKEALKGAPEEEAAGELGGRPGRRPLWLLRFGASQLENALAYQRDRLLLEYPTGYGPGVQRAGFGDRLAVSELYWWLARTR